MVSLLQSARIQFIHCSQKFCVFPDGFTCTSEEDVCRKVFSLGSSVDPELVQGLSKLSWHMPGVERLCQDIKCIRVPQDISILSEDWESHYAHDPFLAPHWETLFEDKVISVKGKEYALYRGNVRVDGHISVPLALTDRVLRAQHSYAHPGVQKTLEMFKRRYISGHTDADLREKTSAVLGSCVVCKTCKPRQGLRPESCHSFSIPEYSFSSVAMDFCDMGKRMPLKFGVSHATISLFLVCRLTGYTMVIPCSKNITAPQLAELYLERVLELIGLPNEIFSDHDHLITADFFTNLCDLNGVQQKQSPVHRPRSNGRAERAIQVIPDIL